MKKLANLILRSPTSLKKFASLLSVLSESLYWVELMKHRWCSGCQSISLQLHDILYFLTSVPSTSFVESWILLGQLVRYDPLSHKWTITYNYIHVCYFISKLEECNFHSAPSCLYHDNSYFHFPFPAIYILSNCISRIRHESKSKVRKDVTKKS